MQLVMVVGTVVPMPMPVFITITARPLSADSFDHILVSINLDHLVSIEEEDADSSCITTTTDKYLINETVTTIVNKIVVATGGETKDMSNWANDQLNARLAKDWGPST